jgi:Mg2+ and Co2+ transporter CorA
VFNLIAQSDTRINIDLAKDSRELAKDSRELAAASKQDSSAMKIIAVLTTLFLPGTFIAVCPFFRTARLY